MRLVALVSGGKDSTFNMLQCIAAGHEIVAIANIEPDTKDELDSYMYQSVGHQVVSLVAAAIGLPIYRQKTKGHAHCKTKTYTETKEDEVEDLLDLIQKVKKEIQIDGVAVGAIASDYQRTRVENVCNRLGLKCFAYLWRRNQAELLQEMIDAELDAIIIKVASIGLNKNHLGMHIHDMKPHLAAMHAKYGLNVCGEGGEYETLTVDCPLFSKRMSIEEFENVTLSDDAFAPVAYHNIKKAVLSTKSETFDPVQSGTDRIDYIKGVVRDPYSYVEDCLEIQAVPKNISSLVLPPSYDPSRADLSGVSSSIQQEMWKRAPSTLQQPHSSTNYLSSTNISILDTATFNMNYSSGWCCISNVSGFTPELALQSLKKHLVRYNYEFDDVVFVMIILRSMADFQSVNRVYAQYMPTVSPPARVCIACNLPPELSMMISVVAHRSVSKSQKALSSSTLRSRDVMHVQSISHWAPANIGPYSQCVRVGDLYYLAGQIPLIPGTMELLNQPIFYQCRLTLRHVDRVLTAMNDNLSISNVFQAICYVTCRDITMDMINSWLYATRNETTTITAVVVKELPRNAQLEWEVVACGLTKPKVEEVIDVMCGYSIYLKRCIYPEPHTSSFLCNISTSKANEARNPGQKISNEILSTVLKHSLQFLEREVSKPSSLLSTLKLFYKPSAVESEDSLIEFIRKHNLEHKVVITGVPVKACQESTILITIMGICH